jgi:tetratricopeptide (TPR) repeat protein
MASRAVFILCLLLPLAISPWGFDDAYYLKEALLLLVGAGLLFGEAVALWRGRAEPIAFPIPLLLLLALAIASVWQAANCWAFAFRLALLLSGIAVFVAVARSAGVPGRPAGYFAALCLSAAVATGYGVIQRLGLDPFLAPDPRFVATFGNPHLYAEFVAPLVPVVLCLALVAQGGRRNAIFTAGLAFPFAGLLWARARGPAIAAVAGLGFVLWALRRTCPELLEAGRRRAWTCGGVLAGIAVLMALGGNIALRKPSSPQTAPRASRAAAVVAPDTPTRSADVGVSFRLVVYRDTLAMVRERPLTGFGLGNFRISYPRFARGFGATIPEVNPVGHVHNDVLEVAAELGLPAAAVFTWMLLAFIRSSLMRPGGAPPEDAWPRIAAGAGLLALGINSLFAFGFYDPATSLELWVFAGISRAPWPGLSVRARGHGLPPFPPALRRAVGVLLAGLGLGLAGLGVSSEIADVFLMRGLERFYTGRYADALAPLEAAARLEVGRTEAMIMAAQTHMEMRRPDRGLAVVQAALGLEPSNPQLHYLRGVALAGMGRFEEGRRSQETALAIYPLYSLPHVALGELAERRGQDVRARAEYEAALRINPRRAEARDALALLAVKAGDLDEAIRLWEEGAHVDPEDATTAHNLSVAYTKKGDTARAAAWQTRAAALRAAPATR